jgi:hypothetical protein
MYGYSHVPLVYRHAYLEGQMGYQYNYGDAYIAIQLPYLYESVRILLNYLHAHLDGQPNYQYNCVYA